MTCGQHRDDLPEVPHGNSSGTRRVLTELAQRGPCTRAVVVGDLPVWVVTGYDHVRAALTDKELIKDLSRLPEQVAPFSGRRYPEDAAALGRGHLLAKDRQQHTQLRRLLAPWFTRQAVERLRPHIERAAARLIEPISRCGQGELLGELVEPLLNEVTCDLLGIPVQGREATLAGSRILTGPLHPEHPAYQRTVDEVAGLLVELLRQRRDEPADDLISAIAGQWRDHQIGLRDAVGGLQQIIAASSVNTLPVMAAGIVALIEQPELAEKLQADMSFVVPLTEELLRWTSTSALTSWRFASFPTRIGDAELQIGDIVLASLDTANRDPRVFPDPDQLCPGRDGLPHLAFGAGPHHCLGAPLARLEVQVMLAALAPHIRSMALAVPAEDLPWCGTTFIHGWSAVPVAFTTTPKQTSL